ncbi:sodium/calcium exchanger NCL2 [Ziziphus jujuba]|uniref:Sodium/calcium exchanger NCL2 n=1 Tax=Ziziphus jujuba TaxID=326968 RepID=A0ABM3I5Q4_ZIZJJ|nr:sodium/calcium exchanger NCL2 [Ziziphus jujuba]
MKKSITKTPCFIFLLLLLVPLAINIHKVRGARGLPNDFWSNDSYLVSDGIDDVDYEDDMGLNQASSSSSFLVLPKGSESEEEECEQMYGFLPCSNSIFGHVFLIVVYEYLLFHGESYVAAGGENIFKILGPGVFGASAFHVLGALPESLILLASGLLNKKEIAEEYVFTGVGLLAGSSILVLTLLWGTCVIAGRQDFSNVSTTALTPWQRLLSLLTSCGITTDLETSYTARIMVLSVIPFIIMQIPNIFQIYSVERIAILISLVFSLVFLFLFFCYQIFQPWIQKRSLEYVKHGHLMFRILQHVQKRALGRVLTNTGAPNVSAIRRLFEEIDEDRDNFIWTSEVKELFLEIKFETVEVDMNKAIAEVMTQLDLDSDRKIAQDEFVNALTKWLCKMESSEDKQSYSARSLSDIHQVFQPWIQNKRKEREIKRNLMSEIQKYVQSNALGSLLTEDGTPDIRNIRRLFERIDKDRDNFISQNELKEVIASMKFGNKMDGEEAEEAVRKMMEELDTSGDHLINEEEFVTGFANWLNTFYNSDNKTTKPSPTTSNHESQEDIFQKTWEEIDKVVDNEEKKNGGVDNSIWGWLKAIMYIVAGICMLAVLAEPLIESVQNFSKAAGINSFFVSFVLVPLATNARAATSAITAATHKTPRTTSLTFSEIYGGVFMNNILGFSVLLGIIYAREMRWEYSAEVLVVVFVCIGMGLIASLQSSFPLWISFMAYLFYPFSLLLVYVFNNVLNYT